MKKSKMFVLTVILITITFFLANPAKYMTSFTNGLIIWTFSVVPALFPFFFLSKLLIDLNFFGKASKFTAPLTKKLFKAPDEAGYIFLISIISGYPVGAKLIEEYYNKGLLSKTDCKKVATFTSVSGPLFILGTVGGKFFGNAALGWVLLICHIISAFVCGLLFRNFFVEEKKLLNKSALKKNIPENILNDAVYSSVSGILTVGTFISIFYMLIDMILSTNVFQSIFSFFSPNLSENALAFLTGILEVTRGCSEISQLGLNINSAAVLISCLISFGGFCVMFQSLCFLSKCGVGAKNMIAIKTVQAASATVLTALWLWIFPL